MRHRTASNAALGTTRKTETSFAIAAVLPLLVLLPILGARGLEPTLFFVLTGLPALLLVLGATAARSGPLYSLAVGLLWTNHLAWLVATERGIERTGIGLVAMAITVVVLTTWPVLTPLQWQPATEKPAAGPAWRGAGWRLTWISAALTGPLWFLPLALLWTQRWRDGAIGLLPLALGALALVVVLRARTLPFGRPALIWSSAVALCAIAAAIPMQLDREWITVSWSVQALAILLLWRRLHHSGLAFFALLLHAAVAIRLLLNPALLSYHHAGALPVLNWLAYTYLVPAAALVASARLLAHGANSGEPSAKDPPSRLDRVWRLAAGGCVAAAIALVFAWINLTILDAFSTGRRLTLDLERLPARDLTLSLAWTLYGLGLLATGMARKAVALRWISLAFLIMTIAKVFLYDLGELTDLYRVASLAGLAVSLILVSLLYQRFVFGTGDGETDDETESAEK